MKVLNLQCAHGHAFEGWFGSEDDFQLQLGRGLLECPMCGATSITKGLTAPRLNLGARPPESSVQAPAERAPRQDVATLGANASAAMPPELQAAYLQAVRHVMSQTEDVGDRFAEEARRIHYGETAERAIRGQASREQTIELLEEGVEVMPLVLPKGMKGSLQ